MTYPQPLHHYLSPGYSLPLLREWHETATVLTPANLIYPIFISDEDPNMQREIPALPQQYHLGVERAVTFLEPLIRKGLRCVILFGVPTQGAKDNQGTDADAETTPVVMALRRLKKAFGDRLVLMVDVCLCAYTSHGHCGVMKSDGITLDNSLSVARLADIALSYAKAGADVVSPSDMTDGRIGALKQNLRANGYGHIPVMSYSAKFASALYGPFRSACATSLKGDRKGYQLPPGAYSLAQRAVQRDVEEGADYLMVKPGTLYLDIITMTKQVGQGIPVAVYHVSGEYAMLWHAAKAGAIDLRAGVMETMVSMRRAGADIILTYYTPMILEWLAEAQKSKL